MGYFTANLLGQFIAGRENRPIAVSLDFGILALVGAITMVALVVFGLFPAWSASRMPQAMWLRQGRARWAIHRSTSGAVGDCW